MKKLLEELWYGNICPSTAYRGDTKEADKLMEYLAGHHDNLWRTLTNEQKDIFKRFDDCYCELTSINERDIFIYAFRLGAKMATEVLSSDI